MVGKARQVEKNLKSYYRETDEDVNNGLVFQAIEWQEFNEVEIEEDEKESEDEGDLDFSKNKDNDEKFVLRIFGVTKKGSSVCLNVQNFTPFFYVKVPETWKSKNVTTFLSKLSEKLVIRKDNRWVKCSKNLIKSKCVIQKKKDFYGFSNNKEFLFLRLVFDNSDVMKRAANIMKSHNKGVKPLTGVPSLPLYEANLDSTIKIAHIKNLNFAGWIKANDFDLVDPLYGKSFCNIEANINWTDLEAHEDNSNAPILQASYDIETYSIDGSFPSPDVKGNVITQIATAFKKYGSDDFYIKHIICLKNCSPIDDDKVILECYDTEREVLLAWTKLINKMDPDVLYQYNGDWFDGHYLYTRAKVLGCEEEFLVLGKMKNILSQITESSFSSSAYGANNYRRLTMPGRINFDILTYIKREYKENSYKLDYISEKYLGQNKNPVTPNMMFEYFASGDPDKINIIAKYCVQDTLLPQRLVDKMHILQNQISMANITCVPIRYLTERGQQIKVFSQILRETRKHKYLVPTIDNYRNREENGEEESFTGATVLPPLQGAYYEPITVCDFASLYPSIIRAHNLCFSTIVLDDKYDNIEGVEYKTFEWEDEIKDKVVKHTYKYVQNTEGILQKLLNDLTTTRKEYKKLMVGTEDPFLQEVYNKCQLAVKVSMNSFYGFFAAPMLCCKPIAATVTAVGRLMIQDTKKYMEDNYDASVAVYGDSVTGDTPLLLKNSFNGNIEIRTIENLGNDDIWKSYEEFKPFDTNRKDKFQSKTPYKIWTDKGWSDIKRVIKHKTDKKIYRVVSNLGAVDVTEDHSLIDKDLQLIKPQDCFIEDTELLSAFPIERKIDLFPPREREAYVLGLFDANGDLTSIDEIMNSADNVKEEYIKGFLQKYKGVVRNKQGEIMSIQTKTKINSAKIYYLLRCIFDNVNIGYDTFSDVYIIYFSDQDFKTNNNKIIVVKELSQYRGFQTVYDLETETGRFQAGIGENIIKNTDSVFVKFKTESTERYKKAFDIYQKKDEKTEQDKKEIDEMKKICIQESIDVGKIAAKNATQALFKYPINLEYEKVYLPLLLLSKKRYIGMLYSENAETPDKMDNKGVILKRRDNFELLKKIYRKVLDILLESGFYGIEKATECIQDVMYKIIHREFDDLDDFVISKSLKADYKNQNIPHVVLAKKLKQRDPGSAPKSNDRVPYVFIDPDQNTEVGQELCRDFIERVKKRSKLDNISSLQEAKDINKTFGRSLKFKTLNQYQKVEDPKYVLENKLPLDAEYYIKFMRQPLCEILSLFIDNPEEIFNSIIKEYNESKW